MSSLSPPPTPAPELSESPPSPSSPDSSSCKPTPAPSSHHDPDGNRWTFRGMMGPMTRSIPASVMNPSLRYEEDGFLTEAGAFQMMEDHSFTLACTTDMRKLHARMDRDSDGMVSEQDLEGWLELEKKSLEKS